jgi:hypothetical protein
MADKCLKRSGDNSSRSAVFATTSITRSGSTKKIVAAIGKINSSAAQQVQALVVVVVVVAVKA